MEKLEILKQHLKKIDDVIANGTYKDDWKTLINHKVPDWYRNAKFGIFIHWGAFTVPECTNEWYPRNVYIDRNTRGGINHKEFHEETYGKPLSEFGYKDLVPLFKAEKFDADEWADMFKAAGAKFVMPVGEHCDGFQMYDSELSDWCVTKMGPMKDTTGLIKKAVEDRGMTFTISSHRAEHYWFMSTGKTCEGSDMPQDPEYAHMYWPSIDPHFRDLQDKEVEVDELFLQDWLARTCEMVDKYRPKIVYFDWWIQVVAFKPYLKKFMAYYYNRALEWGEDVTVNYKHDAFMHTSGVKDIERGQLSTTSPYFWQNDTATAINSWSYAKQNIYKETYKILGDLVDVVSKNGSLLLNVGPRADGSFPEEEKVILKEIGEWINVNGEAIYDTIPWRKYGIGPTVTQEGNMTDTLRGDFTHDDFRFTFKDETLYTFAMNWPEDGVVRIPILGRESKQFNAVIENVEILGYEGATFKLCDDYLTVMCDGIKTKNPVCIKIDTL